MWNLGWSEFIHRTVAMNNDQGYYPLQNRGMRTIKKIMHKSVSTERDKKRRVQTTWIRHSAQVRGASMADHLTFEQKQNKHWANREDECSCAAKWWGLPTADPRSDASATGALPCHLLNCGIKNASAKVSKHRCSLCAEQSKWRADDWFPNVHEASVYGPFYLLL